MGKPGYGLDDGQFTVIVLTILLSLGAGALAAIVVAVPVVVITVFYALRYFGMLLSVVLPVIAGLIVFFVCLVRFRP